MKFCMKCMTQYGDNYTVCPICGFKEGTLPTDHRCIEPGQIVADRYIIGMPLSIDSWIIRYIGWDALTNRKVVINEYLPSRYAAREMGNIALTVVKQKAFYKYMSILLKKSQLLAETHLPDNVCCVHECFESNNTVYIITEYKEGKSLREYMSEKGAMDEKTVERLFLPILKSLDKLHDNGCILGGFSPDNFIVTDENALVLKDFMGNILYNITADGMERKSDETDKYFPEERLSASETIDLSPENDVYSAAIIMCEMMGTELPNPRQRKETFDQKHKELLKIPSAGIAKSEKYKETALLNAAAIHMADRTADVETFMKELTSGKEVVLKTKPKSKFPLWAKITIPVVAAAGIAAAIIIPLMLPKEEPVSNTMIEGQTVVPSLINRSFSEASEELKKSNLLIEVEGKTVDDNRDANTVLSQSTEKGAIVSENTVIGVTVSSLSGEFTMPNFLGIDVRECTRVLENIGLNYAITEEYNSNISSGCVISQSLSPYSKVRAGQRTELIVSKGPEPSEEPPAEPAPVQNLVNQPYEEIVREQSESKNEAPVQVVERVYDSTKPEGTVIQQSPAAGTEQPANEPVKIVITTANENVVVPDVTYLDQERAKDLLSYYGFKTDFSSEQNDTVAEGLIFSQSPSAGSPGKVGDTVQIKVSTGKSSVKMPDTVGKTREEAAKLLKDAGLSVSFTYETDVNKPKDEILKQSIEANAETKIGTAVILTVNSGTEIAAVPDLIGKDVQEADKLVTAAGFNLIIYADEEHPNTEGIVAAQGPKAGLYAEKGSDMVVILAVDPPQEGSAESSDGSAPPAVKISTDSAAIAVGEEFVLEIDLTGVENFAAVEYDISNTEIVDVVHIDKETLAMTFRGLAEGETDIVISYGELRQTCHVVVGSGSAAPVPTESKEEAAPDIIISPESVTLKVNEAFDLSVNAVNIPDLEKVEYFISDEHIIREEHIDPDTMTITFRGTETGEASVRITYQNIEKICKVTVQ